MNKRILCAFLALLLLMTGCHVEGQEAGNPQMPETTAPTETTAPVETTTPPENTIAPETVSATEPSQRAELPVLYDTECANLLATAESNADKSSILSEYADKWKALADDYYEQALLLAGDSLHESLVTGQQAWESYADAHLQEKLDYLEQYYEGGSIVPVLMAQYTYDLYRERAVTLYTMASSLSEYGYYDDRIPAEYLIQDTPENQISVHLQGFTDEKLRVFAQEQVVEKLEEQTGERFSLTASETDIPMGTDYSQYGIDLQVRITYQSKNLVSILFEGLLNHKDAAHPVNLFFAVNLDPNTLTAVSFSSLYALDTGLYIQFAEVAENEILADFDPNFLADIGGTSAVIPNETTFLQGMSAEDGFYWYRTKTTIVFSYPVPHALGDCRLAAVPVDLLAPKS